MSNDSSTGGYLVPNPPPAPQPLEDDALEDFLQSIIVGLTGLPGTLVFPRWQQTPPNIPAPTVDWASIGIMDNPADTYAYEAHNPVIPPNPFPPLPSPAPTPPPNGYDIQIQHEKLEILASFYGPHRRSNAALVRSGLQVAQNREAMSLQGIGFVECSRITTFNELVNNQWYNRLDLPIVLRREIVRQYPILDLVSSQITEKTSTGITDVINVTHP